MARYRTETWALHRFRGEPEPRCPWCLGFIRFSGDWDVHEAIIKRSAIPKRLQERYIFLPENCVAAHHSCHMWYGQTREFLVASIILKRATIGLERVVRWHRWVASEVLSVRKIDEDDLLEYLQLATKTRLVPTDKMLDRWSSRHPVAFSKITNELPTVRLGSLT